MDEVQEEPSAEDAVATQRRCWVRSPVDGASANSKLEEATRTRSLHQTRFYSVP